MRSAMWYPQPECRYVTNNNVFIILNFDLNESPKMAYLPTFQWNLGKIYEPPFSRSTPPFSFLPLFYRNFRNPLSVNFGKLQPPPLGRRGSSYVMYVKFQKLLITGCRDMDKKNLKNTSQMGFFPKSGSVTFVPLWSSNFMKKIRKNQ